MKEARTISRRKASDALLMICTTPDKTSAETIAQVLLDARLCACVNIIGPVQSLFHWEGKIDRAEEYILFIKTRKSLYRAAETAIKSKHSYTVPEIVSCALRDVQPDYLAWIHAETRRKAPR